MVTTNQWQAFAINHFIFSSQKQLNIQLMVGFLVEYQRLYPCFKGKSGKIVQQPDYLRSSCVPQAAAAAAALVASDPFRFYHSAMPFWSCVWIVLMSSAFVRCVFCVAMAALVFYLRLLIFCFNLFFLSSTFLFLLLEHFLVILESLAFAEISYASQAIDCVILVLPFHVRRLKKFMQVPLH